MPLVVSSLTGDTSDMFDWICSVSLGENITVVPSLFGSTGTWSRTYARELVKMPLIL